MKAAPCPTLKHTYSNPPSVSPTFSQLPLVSREFQPLPLEMTTVVHSELLLQTAISVLYKQLFHSLISLDIDLVVKRPRAVPLPPAPPAPLIAKKKAKTKRRKIDPALEELILTGDDTEKAHNGTGKRRGKPDFLRYSDLILQEELRKADDISEFAESMEEELTTELKKRKQPRKPRKPLTQANGELLKPGKQRKFRTILGVQQQEYSTMMTVELTTASELQTSAGTIGLQPKSELREVNRYFLLKNRAVTLRSEGRSFEALRDLGVVYN